MRLPLISYAATNRDLSRHKGGHTHTHTRHVPDDGAAVADVREDGLVWRRAGPDHRRPHPPLPPGLAQDAGHARLQELELQTNLREDYAKFYNHGEGPY